MLIRTCANSESGRREFLESISTYDIAKDIESLASGKTEVIPRTRPVRGKNLGNKTVDSEDAQAKNNTRKMNGLPKKKWMAIGTIVAQRAQVNRNPTKKSIR